MAAVTYCECGLPMVQCAETSSCPDPGCATGAKEAFKQLVFKMAELLIERMREDSGQHRQPSDAEFLQTLLDEAQGYKP